MSHEMDPQIHSRKVQFLSHKDDYEDRIERWRNEAAPAAGERGGPILHLCLSSLDALKGLIEQSGFERGDINSLRRCYGTLQLWAHQHGVHSGNLDTKLQHFASIRHTVLELLLPLCGTILRSLTICSLPVADLKETVNKFRAILRVEQQSISRTNDSPNLSDTESESENDNPDTQIEPIGIRTVIRKMKTYTECLLDIGYSLDHPALDDSEDDETANLAIKQRSIHDYYTNQRSAEDYHTERLRAKFPLARIEMLQCLGRTSWNRYQRLQKERELRVQGDQVAISDEKSHTIHSKFVDSGLGTSLPAATSSYAASIVSLMSSITGGKQAKLPKLPVEAKNGAPFDCIACGGRVCYDNNRDWRIHLLADLQPYTCFFTDCPFSSSPFQNRRVWATHLELQHNFEPERKNLQCPFCLESIQKEKNLLITHLSHHMEDIAIGAIPQDVDSDSESDDSLAVDPQNVSGLGSERDCNASIPSVHPNGEIRLRIGNDAPITLTLNEDMEGRVLSLVPIENGVNELVISSKNRGESTYRGERGSAWGERERQAVTPSRRPRRDAEKMTKTTQKSSRSKGGPAQPADSTPDVSYQPVLNTRLQVSDPVQYPGSSPRESRPPRYHTSQHGPVIQPAISRRLPASSRRPRPKSPHPYMPHPHAPQERSSPLQYMPQFPQQGYDPSAFMQAQQMQPMRDQQKPQLQARTQTLNSAYLHSQSPVMHVERNSQNMSPAEYHTNHPPLAQRQPTHIAYNEEQDDSESEYESDYSEEELDHRQRFQPGAHQGRPQTIVVPSRSSRRQPQVYDTSDNDLSRSRQSSRVYDRLDMQNPQPTAITASPHPTAPDTIAKSPGHHIQPEEQPSMGTHRHPQSQAVEPQQKLEERRTARARPQEPRRSDYGGERGSLNLRTSSPPDTYTGSRK